MAASAQESERRNTATITATTSVAEAKLESCVRCASSTICTNTFTGPPSSARKPRSQGAASSRCTRSRTRWL